jgi:endoplasmic reticulum Man9GlcNAc2 1,2-alpha-mannosidase
LPHEKNIKIKIKDEVIEDQILHQQQVIAPPSIEIKKKMNYTKSIPHSKGKMKFKGPTNNRQKAVVNAFLHSWKAYKEHAWGEDELRPISKSKQSWFNLGLTIIDSLDTMYIMNLEEEFNEAREWTANSLNLKADRFNNLFEITIRILGGLLSAYHLSGDEMFLTKAYELGNRSMSAFESSKTAIPLSDINLSRMKAKSPHWTADSSLSEVATLQIEFKDLSKLTNDDRFGKAVEKVSEAIHKLDRLNGLAPIYISTETGQFTSNTITLGARGDSYYEYLLKQWIQTGASFDPMNKEIYLLKDWKLSVNGIIQMLVKKSQPEGLTFVGELQSG